MNEFDVNDGKVNRSTGKTAKIAVKALVVFTLINLIFVFFYPLPALGKISAYNLVFPGRKRLPYGDNPSKSYNLSLFNLDAMFASHKISDSQKPDDEFRVILIGRLGNMGIPAAAG